MNSTPSRLLVKSLILFAAAFTPALHSPAQEPDVRAEMGLAARTDDPEESARLLRHAWLIAGLVEKDSDRRHLQREVADKLKEIDRKGVRMVRDLERAVKDLREAAEDYIAMGWYDTAESLLRIAHQAFPEAVEDDLQKLARLRADVVAEQPAAVEPGRSEALQEWFSGGFNPYSSKDFTVTEEAVLSPKLDEPKSQGWFSRHVLNGDGRVRIEIGMPGTLRSKAGLAVSQTNANDIFQYYLAEIEHEQDVLNLALSRIEGSEVRDLALSKINWKCPTDLHYHEVEVVLSGRCVVMQVDDHPTVATAPMLRPNEGAIGLFVSGNTEYKDAVRFRHLVVETLTPHSLQ